MSIIYRINSKVGFSYFGHKADALAFTDQITPVQVRCTKEAALRVLNQ